MVNTHKSSVRIGKEKAATTEKQKTKSITL